jgi:hypothetical protein
VFVCCECCVLSGRGLCDELITPPEESYRLWCVDICDLENLKNEKAITRVGSQRHSKKNSHTTNSYMFRPAMRPYSEMFMYTSLNIIE